MRNIAFLIANAGGDGGTTRVSSLIANSLSDYFNIFVISVVSPTEPKHFAWETEQNKGNTIFFDLGRDKVSISLKDVPEFIVDCIKLYRIIKRINLDCLIVVDTYLYYYIWAVKKMPGLKTLKTIAWEHFSSSYRSRKRDFVRKICLKQADKVVVLSDGEEKKWKKIWKKRKNEIDKVICIYNPITIKVDGKSDINNNRIVAIGHLEPVKGFDMLLEAWKLCFMKLPDWSLTIIGNGKDKEKLEYYIVSHNLERVKILSFEKDISKIYKESSILAISSRHEGFPLVMIEAQAYGLPIVSFRCQTGPAEHLKNKYNALTVEPGDIIGYSNALIQLAQSEELRRILSKNSIASVSRFTLERTTKLWNMIITEIIMNCNKDKCE